MIDILPEKIVEKAYNLRSFGIVEFAWRYDSILEVINILRDNNYIILGGDVHKIEEGGKIIPCIGDTWYHNRASSPSDVNESYKKAVDYINMYHKRNGDGFCYSVVVDI